MNNTVMNEKDTSRSLIAPVSFYVHVMAIALPIMIQNGITNVVGIIHFPMFLILFL